MSGYRRVNYYELCRLCTSSEGNKIHIFREEGRRRQLPTKIQTCLSLQLREDDSLPKNICSYCTKKLESLYSFKETCVNAGKMLERFFSTIRFSDEFLRDGMVYIRDERDETPKTHFICEPLVDDVEDPLAIGNGLEIEESTDANQSQASSVNQVHSFTTIEVERLKEEPIINATDNANLNERIEQEQHVSMSSDSAHSARSQVVQVNARYVSFNNGLVNGDGMTVEKRKSLSNNNNNNNVIRSTMAKSEIGIQHGSSDIVSKQSSDKNGGNSYYIKQGQQTIVNNVVNIGTTNSVVSNVTAALQQAFAFQHSQDMVLHLGLAAKDKETTSLLATDDVLNRSSMAQIGEFLKLKSESVDPINSTEGDNGDSSMQIAMCDTCDKELSTNEELAAHMVHCQLEAKSSPGDKSNSSTACDICGKSFRRKEHLNQHFKLHTGERPYACNVCDKAFSRKEHLIRHSVSHTGLKCHPCEFCGKAFSRKDNLHKHKKTHGIAGPYVCEECGKSFVVKHYYLMHQAMHNAPTDDSIQHKCDICGKVFANKNYLHSHKMRHEKKKKQQEKEEGNSAASNLATEQDHTTDQSDNSPSLLTTINAQALLPSNIIQVAPPPSTSPTVSVSSSQPLFQVCNVSGTQTFVASVASKQLLETFRKLNSS